MKEKVLLVDNHFYISNRGTVVVGKNEQNRSELKVGTSLIIVQPDGTEIETEIRGVEMINPMSVESFKENHIGLLLKNVTKENVPIGSIIFVNSQK